VCWSSKLACAQVKADTGGVAIGGNVSSSTINIGVRPEQLAALVQQSTDLSESQKKLITHLEGELDLNQRQVRAALDILGEKDIPPERLAAKLVEIAERFKTLQAIASAQPGDNLEIIASKSEAQKAIDAGELIKADAVLADVEAQQNQALDRFAANAAATAAQRGDIALARLRYSEAAGHFAKAAAMFPPTSAHQDVRTDYLTKEADALFSQGNEFGDNAALSSAIVRFRSLAELEPRERVPRDWAVIQNSLGNALEKLGERETGTERLEESVAAYRAALTEFTRQRAPLDWAVIQNNLGNALEQLGERESGTERFEQSVVAYREALTERTRERLPLKWAMTQNNLGVALEQLGERESGTERLEQSVAAYREALTERTRERVPRDWAISVGNQGVVLIVLARRNKDIAMANTALQQIEAAIETVNAAGDTYAAAFFKARLLEAAEVPQTLKGH